MQKKHLKKQKVHPKEIHPYVSICFFFYKTHLFSPGLDQTDPAQQRAMTLCSSELSRVTPSTQDMSWQRMNMGPWGHQRRWSMGWFKENKCSKLWTFRAKSEGFLHVLLWTMGYGPYGETNNATTIWKLCWMKAYIHIKPHVSNGITWITVCFNILTRTTCLGPQLSLVWASTPLVPGLEP